MMSMFSKSSSAHSFYTQANNYRPCTNLGMKMLKELQFSTMILFYYSAAVWETSYQWEIVDFHAKVSSRMCIYMKRKS